MKYRAVYEREPDGRWTVEIPDVPGCHTYGRTIDQARERLREALSLFTNDAATAEIEDQVKLPQQVLKNIQAARNLRQTVSQEEMRMVAAQIKAVRTLRRMKLGHRDAGALLGLSHQRVQQLEQRMPLVHGAVISEAMPHRRRVVRKAASKKR